MSGFEILLAALSAVPAALALRRAWWMCIPLAILFTPEISAVLLVARQLGGGVAVQAALLLLHASFLAVLVFHFLLPHRPTRWELLYTVPGQVFFTGTLMYLAARGVAALAGLATSGWVLAVAPFGFALVAMASTHWAATNRTVIEIPALERPLRVVHLSDIHVGTFMGDLRLQRMAARINALTPDLIVATGDFLTIRSERDYSPLLRFFAAIHRPPLGVYGCLGNHDLSVARRLIADLDTVGVRMLVNEAETIAIGEDRSLTLIGLPFFWRNRGERYRDSFDKLTAHTSAPALVMCHDPAAFDTFATDRNALVLAGHLHGGQIGLNWLGLPVSILRLFRMYDQGVFRKDALQMYVHRGTGVYGFPVRIGVPAEVALLELVPVPAGSKVTVDTEALQNARLVTRDLRLAGQGDREKSSASGSSAS